MHGTTSSVKSSVIVGLSTAQIRTGVVHVLCENDSRLLRLMVLRFARNDSRARLGPSRRNEQRETELKRQKKRGESTEAAKQCCLCER